MKRTFSCTVYFETTNSNIFILDEGFILNAINERVKFASFRLKDIESVALHEAAELIYSHEKNHIPVLGPGRQRKFEVFRDHIESIRVVIEEKR